MRELVPRSNAAVGRRRPTLPGSLEVRGHEMSESTSEEDGPVGSARVPQKEVHGRAGASR